MSDKVWNKLLEHDQRFDAVDRKLENLEAEFHRRELLNEDRDRKLDKVLDVVLNIQQGLEKSRWIDPAVLDHEYRIRMLESTTKLKG